MAHAHDQTLLSRLGFNDPDRRNHIHDLACQYIADHANACRFSDLVLGDTDHSECKTISEQEIHIGDSRFTSGLLDVAIVRARRDAGAGSGLVAVEVKASQATAGDALRQIAFYRARWFAYLWADRVLGDLKDKSWADSFGSFFGRNSRQQAGPGGGIPIWVLATCYDITQGEKESLRAYGVRHVRLSVENIRAWARDGGAPSESPVF
jgi:hypothetical protein